MIYVRLSGLETMDDSLFIYGIQATDTEYNIIRDRSSPYATQLRSFMESLWRKYQPYADSNFRQQIQVDLDSRFWEMYLACTLLENSIPLSKVNGGPDIFVEHENRRIWIEAIAPTSGADTNPDRVPGMKSGVVTVVPGDQIVLRYRGAISEKYDNKYHGYVERGIVKATDAYVIAINGCKIPAAIGDEDRHLILQAVFPIGNRQIAIGRTEVIDAGYQPRSQIRRVGGAKIRTDLFVNQEYANLSGVLHSNASVRTFPFAKRMGEDFVFIHNPLATNRLPNGFFKVGREYAQK